MATHSSSCYDSDRGSKLHRDCNYDMSVNMYKLGHQTVKLPREHRINEGQP
jgi:hypothetical protein